VLAPSRPIRPPKSSSKINVLSLPGGTIEGPKKSDPPTGFKPMAVESFPASSLWTKIMGAKVSPAPDQPRPSIRSRNRFMVNSMVCDGR
jgi:hypothetical protein